MFRPEYVYCPLPVQDAFDVFSHADFDVIGQSICVLTFKPYNLTDWSVMLTFAYIKPDGMRPELWAPIFLAMVRMGISVVKERRETISEDNALALYREHLGKPFYPGLIRHTVSGASYLMVLEGGDDVDVVALWRETVEKIRDRFAEDGRGVGPLGLERSPGPRNLVHGSDSPAAARREIALFFPELASAV